MQIIKRSLKFVFSYDNTKTLAIFAKAAPEVAAARVLPHHPDRQHPMSLFKEYVNQICHLFSQPNFLDTISATW